MNATLFRLWRDERGVAGMLLGMLMAVLAGFAALAVDVGYLHMKRSTLQTAADASALAAAHSMLSHGLDFSAIRAVALDYGRKNLNSDDSPGLAVNEADIAFLRNGAPDTTNPNQIEVTIRRTAARGNAVGLIFGRAIGIATADLVVKARAGLVKACASKCIKPFMIPTKFAWDDKADPGTKYFNNGQLDTESPAEMASIQVQGFGPADIGTRVLLKPGDPHLTIAPSQYNVIDLPPVNKGNPVSGADAVKENIVGCTGSNNVVVTPGDEIQLEPGNNTGPVKQGINDVMAEDPLAYWDDATQSVQDSAFADPMASPRVGIIAFYDPRYPPVSGRNTLFVYQLGAVFIESMDSKDNISARFIKAVAKTPGQADEGPCDLYMVRLLLDSAKSQDLAN